MSLDRHSQIEVELPPNSEIVHLNTSIGFRSFRSTISDADFFTGRRVLLSKSRNNELTWICDWITYHQELHGADAVLLFDNCSSKYDVKTLAETIAKETKVQRIGIVIWDFPFGPRPGPTGVFDSDYCQFGALECAHQRFLPKAKSVLSVDVDELVVSRKDESIFELVEKSKLGFLTFRGIWTTLVDEDPSHGASCKSGCRHRDFRFSRLPSKTPFFALKWAVAPGVFPHGQWAVHGINTKAALGRRPCSNICYRHFLQLSTNWKYNRSKLERYDPQMHFLDEQLICALKIAFK